MARKKKPNFEWRTDGSEAWKSLPEETGSAPQSQQVPEATATPDPTPGAHFDWRSLLHLDELFREKSARWAKVPRVPVSVSANVRLDILDAAAQRYMFRSSSFFSRFFRFGVPHYWSVLKKELGVPGASVCTVIVVAILSVIGFCAITAFR